MKAGEGETLTRAVSRGGQVGYLPQAQKEQERKNGALWVQRTERSREEMEPEKPQQNKGEVTTHFEGILILPITGVKGANCPYYVLALIQALPHGLLVVVGLETAAFTPPVTCLFLRS